MVSESTVPTLNGSLLYYDMMRHSADCFEAAAIRENPNANSAGLTQVQHGSVKVAPNPFEQLLTVTAKAPIQALTLRDAQGKVVLQTYPAAQSVELQTAHLQSGVYFLEVQSTNGIELVKVVK